MTPNLTWESLGVSWDTLTTDPDAQWNLATLSVPDYLKFRVNESSSLIQSFSTRQDALRVSLGESAIDSFLQSTRQDALRARLLETAVVDGVVVAVDTLRVGVSEATLDLLSRSDVQDALVVALQEIPVIAVDLDVSDSLNVRLRESFRLYSETSAADVLLVEVGELANVIVIMGSDSEFPFGKDALRVALTETSVHCVTDWPDEAPVVSVWVTESGSIADPWEKRAPVNSAWSEQVPLTPQEEGCKP